MVALIDNRILWLELYKAENTIHKYLLVHYFTFCFGFCSDQVSLISFIYLFKIIPGIFFEFLVQF